MGITQSQLKYKTLFSGLKFQLGVTGTREHEVKNEKSKKRRNNKEYINKINDIANFWWKLKWESCNHSSNIRPFFQG